MSDDLIKEAFGIFEGGGAKGIAHIGALRAVEKSGIRFRGVAGTSAGAIIAALIAVGYTSDELFTFDRNGQRGLFDIDLLSLFDDRDLERARILRNLVTNITGHLRDGTPPLKKVLCDVWSHIKLIQNWFKVGGVVSLDTFKEWLDVQLAAKIHTQGNFNAAKQRHYPRVLFRDVPLPLKVIASDVTGKQIRVYSQERDAGISVASAVAASASIPYVFKPIHQDGRWFVDGGPVSNFPVWVFDEERDDAVIGTPTLGFKLVTTPPVGGEPLVQKKTRPAEEEMSDAPPFDPIAHGWNTFELGVFGDNSLETRNVWEFHEIKLPMDIGPLDFDMTADKKRAVIDEAYRNGIEGLGTAGILWQCSSSLMERVLQMVDRAIRTELNHAGHLRVNVMLPVRRNVLRLVHGFNMDKDYDIGIEFRRGTGACGKCWDDFKPVVCDLTDARQSYANRWQMSERQQRLVRKSLQSLVSIPIYNNEKLRQLSQAGDPHTFPKAFIGVLNVDSDDNLSSTFQQLFPQLQKPGLETSPNIVTAVGFVAKALLGRLERYKV